MTRFFVRPDQIQGPLVDLDTEDALHLDRVLRAKLGDGIEVVDGSGRCYAAKLIALSKTRATAEILGFSELDTEPSVSITVAEALPKTSEKLEWVLQHGVEVGAAGFVIFRSRRSTPGKLAEKPERWTKIVKTAAEQSGRAKLPSVEMVSSLNDVLELAPRFDLTLLFDESERDNTLRQTLLDRKYASILILIGPEGGWADEEREAALSMGAKAVTLGKRVLRTETAALVALSQILFASDAG